MIALKAHFDGKVFVPDEPVQLAPNQQVQLTVAPAADAPAKPILTDGKIPLGQQPGVLRNFAPDWEAPLPESIWGLDDKK
jgi:hypothetical protein